MKTAVIITCTGALLAGIGFTSCSAGTGTSSTSATQQTSPTNRIQRLEQIYNSPQSSEIERLGAASELVRLGVSNPKYWLHVQREGRTALRREQVADRAWKKQQREEYAGNVERLVADRNRIADASVGMTASSSSASTVSTVSTTKVTGYTENLSVAGREPKLTDLSGIMALAASKHPDALPALRKTVEGSNLLFAAEAALGLANLKDHESVPLIVDAADRFDEGFLFARALVYFGTTNANDEAERLLRDKPKLLRELKATAEARGYEPFGAK